MRSNIDATRTALESLAETDTVQVDGDASEARIRALLDSSVQDAETVVESALDDVDASVLKTKYVVFGVEVVVA